ncbi:MAG TPA: cytidylate kinase [Candidatus Omnitrophica bacterium]|nr:cytidylate kinase [Candidatus Omnitrophota bacterium]HBQ38080.1 cytidylate kinase [Candidatus Omnitrophota bacterium]
MPADMAPAPRHRSTRPLVITIDGPAGAGKSTAAKLLAKQLGLMYLDTGATYRALAYAALRRRIDLADRRRLARLGRALPIRLKPLESGAVRVLLNGEEVTRPIRTERVTEAAAILAQYPSVRQAMVRLQRRLAAASLAAGGTPSPARDVPARSQAGVVAEGRDTGSVVFPHARYKFFLTASTSIRATRRQEELRGVEGRAPSVARIARKLRQRDRLDRTRRTGPLIKPAGCIVLDTSHLGIEDVVERLRRYLPHGPNSDCVGPENSIC